MRILILGGTVFVGRALTDAALAAGHHVQHVNRGKSRPPDPRVQTLHADRTDAASLASALADHRWDAAIDTSGYLPQVVEKSARALEGLVRRYCFISSISVYASFAAGGHGEESPVSPAPDPLPEAMTPETYGPLKAACEGVVNAVYGERALVIRPGLIVGPNDPTDRFTYWPVRLARGGKVLAPGRRSRAVQFIDVRDLAEWTVALIERDMGGTFNATGPGTPLTMEQLLATCRVVAESDATFEWVDDAFLVEQAVAPWREMPLWIPETDPALRGFMGTSIKRALDAGLRFRSLDVTVQATLEWAKSRAEGHGWKAGMAGGKEMAVLEAWGKRKAS